MQNVSDDVDFSHWTIQRKAYTTAYWLQQVFAYKLWDFNSRSIVHH